MAAHYKPEGALSKIVGRAAETLTDGLILGLGIGLGLTVSVLSVSWLYNLLP